MKRIAMLAAFPPPVSGQSLAAQILHDGLDPGEFHVFRLNLAESINGDPALRRLLQLAGVASRLCALCIRDKSLIVYMQLGFGRMAILRDIVYLAITRAFGRRCIVHVHGSGFRVAFDSLPKPLAALDRLLLSKVDCAIVLSQSLCDMFDGIVPKARIAVVKNGVSPRVENAARKYLRPMRDAHTPFRILFLSNLLHAKGFATLLEAAVLAQAAGHDWHFTFVGPKIPGQTIDIQDFITAHRLKNVLWRGAAFGSEKIQCYREADCFVLPSEFEGQPLCILEAMHFGLPVVTTAVGGIPDIFANDPTGVRFIPTNDPTALYETLQSLAQSPQTCLTMSAANQTLARQEYTAQAHVQGMQRLFSGK